MLLQLEAVGLSREIDRFAVEMRDRAEQLRRQGKGTPKPLRDLAKAAMITRHRQLWEETYRPKVIATVTRLTAVTTIDKTAAWNITYEKIIADTDVALARIYELKSFVDMLAGLLNSRIHRLQ